ncbi:DUF2905 domain-containing protein [Hymenobacter sp. GOD-10R]|uniref:DUF2905 domain-containing protein n=1 Tax=Hymenobacter sp. GOD-10R TaxID=3093922 RepID=UPI002D7A38B3|nr:DUF2905 domain-containing protein [Hymenobacter sp. GOD-10R]WRQ27010.1 DUF2905 domain-containing protein [Hymenobacter sp. GOD-10R]
MTPQLGKILVLLGLGIVLLGAFLWLGGGSLLGWFGRLPGDVRVERPGFRLYAPFVSMVLISLLLSLIMWLVRRFGG